MLDGVREEEKYSTLLLGPCWEEERFRKRVRGAKALVSDNDGTVIAGSQWLDMRSCMTEEDVETYDRNVREHFDGPRSDEADVRLIMEDIRCLVSSRLSSERMSELVAAQRPRGGIHELFRSFPFGNAALVSYGLHDYVSGWAARHDVPVAETYALRLRWRDDDGRRVLDGCDESTVVTEATKGAAREAFCAKRKVAERDVIVLEDTPSMLARMKHPDNVGILILPAHDPQPMRTAERLRQLEREGHFDAIDAFLVADDWHLLAAMRRGDF